MKYEKLRIHKNTLLKSVDDYIFDNSLVEYSKVNKLMLDKEEDIKRNLKVEFEKKLKKTEDDFNTIINSINSSLEKSDNRATELKKELDFNKETLKKLEKEVIE